MNPLAIGIGVSLLLHVALLMVRFVPPELLKFIPTEPQLEVVLLNAQSRQAPLAPEVLAQVNMEAGGDRDSGRSRSPLPAETKAQDGDALQEQQARLQELEEKQRRLLALGLDAVAPAGSPAPAPVPEPAADKAPNAEETAAMIARLQAQIDRGIEDYSKRPRRLTYGINAVGVKYARYVNEWADTIEEIGTERFPAEARGKMYDSLIITVEIDRFGNVVDVLINKKSRYETLNRVVKQIVYAGAPYRPFSEEMRKEGDILQIVRTWTFTKTSLKTKSVPR